MRHEFEAEFDVDARPFRFTGEMVYPWLFDEDPSLVLLHETAELLATKDDWPDLYDPERLAANAVPVAAAVCVDDMYVPFELSRATAGRVGALRAWITNTHQHDGIREDGAAVFTRLLGMARGMR